MNGINQTMRRFGYPETLVAETPHWSVQVRPVQAVLGQMVLVCREPVLQLSRISAAAHAGLKPLIERTEACLARAFVYDKINWLLLMMVDPDVHFHVLPRYAAPRSFAGVTFTDPGWPAAPSLGYVNTMQPSTLAELTAHLRQLWQSPD
jgi:diadenosine tetraphosphate (Ap4A) HIT family hydrolase